MMMCEKNSKAKRIYERYIDTHYVDENEHKGYESDNTGAD